MRIKSLKLKNFRNYSSGEFDFDSNLTLVIGPNAIGKTNLLDAIYFLASGKSFRANHDSELIRAGEAAGFLEAEVFDEKEDQFNIDVAFAILGESDRVSKRYKVNGVPRRLADFTGTLKAVIFSPEEINLVNGAPALRRRHINGVLAQSDRPYMRTLSEYEKVVKQRNRLLELIRDGEQSEEQLDLWNEKFLQLATMMTTTRQKFFDEVNLILKKISTEIKVEYLPKTVSEESLERLRDREIAAAMTLRGPHRDDFRFLMTLPNERDLASFGSRGEQRISILHLKIAELEFMKKTTDERPILLLDDIFSELDDDNRQRVLELIKNQQTLITTANSKPDFADKFPHSTINL